MYMLTLICMCMLTIHIFEKLSYLAAAANLKFAFF